MRYKKGTVFALVLRNVEVFVKPVKTTKTELGTRLVDGRFVFTARPLSESSVHAAHLSSTVPVLPLAACFSIVPQAFFNSSFNSPAWHELHLQLSPVALKGNPQKCCKEKLSSKARKTTAVYQPLPGRNHFFCPIENRKAFYNYNPVFVKGRLK